MFQFKNGWHRHCTEAWSSSLAKLWAFFVAQTLKLFSSSKVWTDSDNCRSAAYQRIT